MRWLVAWVFYLIGDLICRVFDRWLPWGMHWPVYRTYSLFMGWSDRVQGNGPGPWGPVLT